MRVLRDEGMLRSIGVSNFSPRRFEEQFFKKVDEIPAVNQIERHPFLAQNETVAYCREKGIQVEAYCPLNRARTMDDPVLVGLAEKYGKTVAQVMLRHQLQEEIVAVPKSKSPGRIRENADVYDFEISPDDVRAIDALNRDDFATPWRPEEDWF